VDVPPAPRLSAAALEHLRETCVRQAALLRQPQLGAIGVRVAAAGPQVAVEPPSVCHSVNGFLTLEWRCLRGCSEGHSPGRPQDVRPWCAGPGKRSVTSGCPRQRGRHAQPDSEPADAASPRLALPAP
jgi:hypothetical protein